MPKPIPKMSNTDALRILEGTDVSEVSFLCDEKAERWAEAQDMALTALRVVEHGEWLRQTSQLIEAKKMERRPKKQKKPSEGFALLADCIMQKEKRKK